MKLNICIQYILYIYDSGNFSTIKLDIPRIVIFCCFRKNSELY